MDDAPPQTTEMIDVAVIGGGLAGLTATDRLLAAGKTVLLLEARSVVGGKVQNRTLENGGMAEMGAEFIGPTQDKVLAMMKELDIATFPVYDDGKYVLWRRGKRTPYPKRLWLDSLPPFSFRATIQCGLAQLRLDRMVAQIDVKAPWKHPKAKKWDAMTLEDWVNKHAYRPDTRFMFDALARSLWGAETSELNLLWVLTYIAGAGNEKTKGTFDRIVSVKNGAQQWRAVGGTGLIGERLAARIGAEHIKLNTPVTKVSTTEGGYVVEWEGGRVMAKKVVLAMPPPLVSKIAFEPALPERRSKLNECLRMGQMGKAIAIYKTPFWRKEGLNGQCFPDQGVLCLTFDNSPEDDSFGALLGFFAGDEMRKVDQLSEAEIRKRVLEEFVSYFGPKAAEAEDVVIQRWGIEKHVYGGPTAFPPVGVFAELASALREPVEGLHFAGTETSQYWSGYMDGAIRSGQRVAEEILSGN